MINEYEFLKLIKDNEEAEAFDFDCWGAEDAFCGTKGCLCGNWIIASHREDKSLGEFECDNRYSRKRLRVNFSNVSEKLGITEKEFDFLFRARVMKVFRTSKPGQRSFKDWARLYGSHDSCSTEFRMLKLNRKLHINRVKKFLNYKLKKAAEWQKYIDDTSGKRQVENTGITVQVKELVNET